MSSDNTATKPAESTLGTVTKRRRWTRWILTLTAAALVLWLLRPLTVNFALWRGETHLENRDHDAALSWLNLAYKLDSDNGETHYLLARCHRRLGHFDEVKTHLEAAHELGVDVNKLQRENLIAMAQTGQYEALEGKWSGLFANAGSDGPEISEAFVTACLGRLQLDEALQVLHAWEKDFPDDPKPHILRGRMAEAVLNWGEALSNYNSALKKKPTNYEAKVGKARALMKVAKYSEAEPLLRDAMTSKEDREAQVLLARCLVKLQKISEARSLLQQLVKDNANDASILTELGLLELGRGNAKLALPLLSKAVATHPSDTELRYAHGKALKAVGRNAEAEVEFQFVNEATKPLVQLSKLTEKLRTSPDDIELRHRIATIVWQYRSREQGAIWFLSNLRTRPGHRPTHKALAAHYRWLGDRQKAAMHSKLATKSPEAP